MGIGTNVWLAWEWEWVWNWNLWEWEGMEKLKSIPAHLYCRVQCRLDNNVWVIKRCRVDRLLHWTTSTNRRYERVSASTITSSRNPATTKMSSSRFRTTTRPDSVCTSHQPNFVSQRLALYSRFSQLPTSKDRIPACDRRTDNENASTEKSSTGGGKCKYGKWSRNVGASIHRWRNHRWIALRNRHYKTPKNMWT